LLLESRGLGFEGEGQGWANFINQLRNLPDFTLFHKKCETQQINPVSLFLFSFGEIRIPTAIIFTYWDGYLIFKMRLLFFIPFAFFYHPKQRLKHGAPFDDYR
jgi:hypothetical protein